jgi:hypothetical protein
MQRDEIELREILSQAELRERFCRHMNAIRESASERFDLLDMPWQQVVTPPFGIAGDGVDGHTQASPEAELTRASDGRNRDACARERLANSTRIEFGVITQRVSELGDITFGALAHRLRQRHTIIARQYDHPRRCRDTAGL